MKNWVMRYFCLFLFFSRVFPILAFSFFVSSHALADDSSISPKVQKEAKFIYRLFQSVMRTQNDYSKKENFDYVCAAEGVDELKELDEFDKSGLSEEVLDELAFQKASQAASYLRQVDNLGKAMGLEDSAVYPVCAAYFAAMRNDLGAELNLLSANSDLSEPIAGACFYPHALAAIYLSSEQVDRSISQAKKMIDIGKKCYRGINEDLFQLNLQLERLIEEN